MMATPQHAKAARDLAGFREAPVRSISRWQPYPAYKPSGVKWLGDIPAHWGTERLKYLTAQPITDGPHTTPEFISEGIPFLSVDGIQEGALVFEGCRYISPEDHEAFKKKALPRHGDILLGKAASTGKIARVKVDFEFSIWSPLALIRPAAKVVDSAYLEFAFKSPEIQSQIDVLCTSNTQKNISMDDIPLLAFAHPPLKEQRAIAAFLDRETTRLDALIAKKQRLIELLQEQRTALISQAVTKGLDPNVAMKDSGVEWLGEIPAHWEVTRLKSLTSFVTSGSRGWAAHYSDTGALFLRIGNLSRKSIELDMQDIQRVDPPSGAEGRRTRVQPDDVLISVTANIGSVGVVPRDIEEAYVNQHIALTRPRLNTVSSRWVAYFLASISGQLQFQQLQNGGTKVGLGLEDVRNLWILLPPYNEQSIVVAFIDEATERISCLITKINDAIDRLREYRTALISAAVTGKIDVASTNEHRISG